MNRLAKKNGFGSEKPSVPHLRFAIATCDMFFKMITSRICLSIIINVLLSLPTKHVCLPIQLHLEYNRLGRYIQSYTRSNNTMAKEVVDDFNLWFRCVLQNRAMYQSRSYMQVICMVINKFGMFEKKKRNLITHHAFIFGYE